LPAGFTALTDEKRNHFGLETGNIDVAGRKHIRGIGIIAECRENVLERHLGGTGCARTLGRPGQRAG
jgi:hypothetical protein